MISMLPEPLVIGTYCGGCQNAEKERCRLGVDTVLMARIGMFPRHKCDKYIYEPGTNKKGDCSHDN